MEFKTEKDFNGYWLKNVKTHKGHEGEPLVQASVYKDGKRIGFYSDGDWGGPSDLQEFTKFCATLTGSDFEPWGEVIYLILDALDQIKWIKKQMKTKTIFALKGDKADEFRTIKVPWKGNEKRISDFLNEKYSDTYHLIFPPGFKHGARRVA